MASLKVATGDRTIEAMLALARCSAQHRILVAGSKSIEMMMELQRRCYLRAAATGNCGRPAGQYDVALVDGRRRPLRTLETTLDWLVNFISPSGVLVMWVDAQKPTANQSLRDARLHRHARHRPRLRLRPIRAAKADLSTAKGCVKVAIC
jgi:hypothetical protein